jgi:hypothetical protein
MHGNNVAIAILLRTGLNNVVVPIWFNNIAQHCYYSQSDSTMLCNVLLTTVKCEQWGQQNIVQSCWTLKARSHERLSVRFSPFEGCERVDHIRYNTLVHIYQKEKIAAKNRFKALRPQIFCCLVSKFCSYTNFSTLFPNMALDFCFFSYFQISKIANLSMKEWMLVNRW